MNLFQQNCHSDWSVSGTEEFIELSTTNSKDTSVALGMTKRTQDKT